MYFYICFFILDLTVLAYVTIRGRDLYPFSHYPMFSARHTMTEARVYRLALETPGGDLVWWRSDFYRYPEYVGRRLLELYQNGDSDKGPDVFVSLEIRHLLSDVLRLIKIDDLSDSNYIAFHIVERGVSQSGQKLKITERSIDVVPFERLQSGINP